MPELVQNTTPAVNNICSIAAFYWYPCFKLCCYAVHVCQIRAAQVKMESFAVGLANV